MKERMAMIVGNRGGSTAEFLIQKMLAGELNIDPAVLIAPSSDAETLLIAKKYGVPGEFIYFKNFEEEQEYSLVFNKVLKKYETTLISLNGTPIYIPAGVIDKYPGRIKNQHGGPLPETAGLFGIKIATKVLELGLDDMEVVIQEVDPVMDRGKVVASARVPILPGDTPKILQARGKPYEHNLQLSYWNEFIEKL